MSNTFGPENDVIWQQFYTARYAEIKAKQESKGQVNEQSIKINLSQYKEAVYHLESLCHDFNKVNPEILGQFEAEKPAKIGHIRGFLIFCHVQGLIKLQRKTVIYLIPEEYRNLVQSILR